MANMGNAEVWGPCALTASIERMDTARLEARSNCCGSVCPSIQPPRGSALEAYNSTLSCTLWREQGQGGFVSFLWGTELGICRHSRRAVGYSAALAWPYVYAYACRGAVDCLEPRPPCLTSKEITCLQECSVPGVARLVGPPSGSQGRSSTGDRPWDWREMFAATDHDFPFPPAGGSGSGDVRHGCWEQEGGSREMSAKAKTNPLA